MEVVHRIEVDVFQLAHLRLDVARHGDIDHEDGLVATLLERPLHRALAEDRQLAGSGADDDVTVDQFVRNVGQQHGMGAEFFRQVAGALQGSVGNDDTPHALFMEVTGDQGDGLAGADQQGLAAAEVAEDLLGQADRGKGHRHRVLTDRGVGAYRLGGVEGGLEQAPQQRTDGTGLAGHGIGRLELTKDLWFAQHHGVQPRGHAHHVPYRGLVLVQIDAGAQIFQGDPVVLGEPGQHGLRQTGLQLQIEFAAIAGGENRRFATVGGLLQLAQGFDRLLRSESHTFAHLNRGGLVIDAEREKGHGRKQSNG